jgi:glutaminase
MRATDVNATKSHLRELYERYLEEGYERVVSYYPAEMEELRHLFGIAYTAANGEAPISVGDCDYAFPLQSICKVVTYGLALEDNGRECMLDRVGVEPSGEAYNAFRFDARENRPFNPMVNAGALVAAELVNGKDRTEKVERIVEKVRVYAGNPTVSVDPETLDFELASNDRNLGLSYLMRSLGMLRDDTDLEENMAVYLAACSVAVDTRDLSVMGATLANGGVNPLTGERAVERKYVRDVLTVMLMCGMYDAAGMWAYDVGVPAKSGVCGGILAAMPHRGGFGFFSPGLDVNGNSQRGILACRELNRRYGLHVFGDPVDDRLSITD